MAQEALIRAWRMRRSCRAADPSAWLRQIARNESLRARARAPSHADLEQVTETVDDDEIAERLPERLDLAAALGELTPLERRLVALRYGADMTQPGIAKLLGMPEGTVKVRLHRARRALAEGMEER